MRQSKSYSVTAGVATVQALGPRPDRKALILSAPAAGRVSYALGEGAVLDSGITLHAAQQPLRLDVNELGEAITQAVSVIASAGAPVLSILEITGP